MGHRSGTEGCGMAFAIQSRPRVCVLLFCTGILLESGAVAWAQDQAQVQVLVYDESRVQRSVLEAGELEASRIFRVAGIRMAWFNCSIRLPDPEKEHCRFVPEARQLVLRLIPKGKTSSDLVFGEAFLGEGGMGTYADVFTDRIKAAHEEYEMNVSLLLGAVVAHELGHLLLGFQGHSWDGIMTPVWGLECLRRIGMGSLLFSREQGARMQSRLDQGEPRKCPQHGFEAKCLRCAPQTACAKP